MQLLLQIYLALAIAVHSGLARPLENDQIINLFNKRPEPNLRPLIGIVSQPGMPAEEGYSYIAASYIKFVETAGARPVPILHDMSRAEITRIFNAVNGILIPGGGQNLSPGHSFYDTVAVLWDLVIDANDKGDFIPMHGTCLGFETLAILASGNTSVLSTYDAEDYPQPLLPTELAATSDFFTSLPPHVVDNLENKPYAMQNHHQGVAWSAFKENPTLDAFFNVLTLSVDRSDNLYVSTIEAKEYPITGTQWHPEKNAFEWSIDLHIPHDPEAVEVTQEVANFFVSAARRNQHRPESVEEEEEMLIYNWNGGLRYTGKHVHEGEEVNFDETYFFPDAAERNRVADI